MTSLPLPTTTSGRGRGRGSRGGGGRGVRGGRGGGGRSTVVSSVNDDVLAAIIENNNKGKEGSNVGVGRGRGRGRGVVKGRWGSTSTQNNESNIDADVRLSVYNIHLPSAISISESNTKLSAKLPNERKIEIIEKVNLNLPENNENDSSVSPEISQSEKSEISVKMETVDNAEKMEIEETEIIDFENDLARSLLSLKNENNNNNINNNNNNNNNNSYNDNNNSNNNDNNNSNNNKNNNDNNNDNNNNNNNDNNNNDNNNNDYNKINNNKNEIDHNNKNNIIKKI